MKLLAVDMDGTCLNSQKVLPPETLAALQKAQDNGLIVVPTTGRTLNWLPKGLRNWGGYRYVISSNGAKILDCRENRVLRECGIGHERAVELLEACRGKGLGLTAHIQDDYYLQGLFLLMLGRRSFREDASGFRYARDISRLVQRRKTSVEEVQIFLMKPENRSVVENILRDFPELSVAWDKTYVEIVAPGVSKGAALSALCAHLGIGKEDIACIGDNENDVSMFDAAGLRFAMGNAVPELINRADIVLPTNDEFGVVHAVDMLLKN
jgi:Cof subfamily protein (haloacid dehalogenase superfamily)